MALSICDADALSIRRMRDAGVMQLKYFGCQLKLGGSIAYRKSGRLQVRRCNAPWHFYNRGLGQAQSTCRDGAWNVSDPADGGNRVRKSVRKGRLGLRSSSTIKTLLLATDCRARKSTLGFNAEGIATQ